MEKHKPYFVLADIKAAFGDTALLNRSYVSRQGADELNMGDSDVVRTSQASTHGDFEKSMTSIADHRIWQDV